MKTLNTIQTLAKIGKVISRIVYICGIIALCAGIAGLILLPLGAGAMLKLGGISLNDTLASGIGVGAAWVAVLAWTIRVAGEMVVARFSWRYFAGELQVGTPFTRAGAREMQRLGILTIAVPLGCTIASAIITGIAGQLLQMETELTFDNGSSVTIGVMLLILSLICRYGAELTENT